MCVGSYSFKFSKNIFRKGYWVNFKVIILKFVSLKDLLGVSNKVHFMFPVWYKLKSYWGSDDVISLYVSSDISK